MKGFALAVGLPAILLVALALLALLLVSHGGHAVPFDIGRR